MAPSRLVREYGSRRLEMVLLLLAFSATLNPVSAAPSEAESGLPAIRVLGVGQADLEALEAAGFDIAYSETGYAEILLHPGDQERLEELGYRVEPLERDLFPGAGRFPREGNLAPEYHTFAEMLSELHYLEETYPSICRVYDIGDALSKNYTWDNYNKRYDIWALKISDNPDLDEPEPCIVYDGRHHAREPVTTEITLAVARHFCQNYASDPRIRQIVDSSEIWCVPMVNPDGHQWVEDVNVNWRKTLHDHNQNHHVDANEGIDPNRNYDWNWVSGTWNTQTYGGPYPWSAPEVVAMRDLFLQHRPAINPSYHSYGEVVLYPFGYEVIAEPAVVEVASEYANRVGYTPQQSTTANGSSKDWLYGTVGAASFTVETATVFIPTGAQMLQIVQQILPGSIWLAERLWGPSIQGTVTDAQTGEPILATIHIPEIQENYGNGDLLDMRTEAATGYYCRVRPAAQETITLQVSAEGYLPQDIQVTTGGSSATVRNVQLQREASGVVDSHAGPGGLILRFGNPYRPASLIQIVNPVETALEGEVGIYDSRGALVKRLFAGSLASGPVALSWDGRGDHEAPVVSGIYFLHSRVGEEEATRKIVLIR